MEWDPPKAGRGGASGLATSPLVAILVGGGLVLYHIVADSAVQINLSSDSARTAPHRVGSILRAAPPPLVLQPVAGERTLFGIVKGMFTVP